MPAINSFFIFLLLLTSPAVAQITTPKKWGAGFYIDQDLAVPLLNEDRDYTMGIAIEFFWQDKEAGLYPLDGTLKRIGQWLGLHEKGDEIVRSFILGSVTYTPDDLANPNPIYDDRPYSSLIYLSNKRVRTNRKNATGIELQVGLLGTDISGDIQTSFHQIWRKWTGNLTPVDPMGWDHQISEGGELTFRLRMSNSQLWIESQGFWDLTPSWTVTLGYQNNLSVGLAGRIGNITSPSWSLPYDPINRGNFMPFFKDSEWYGWAAYRLRMVAYDALLQGQRKDSDVTFESDEIEGIVHEGGIGMTLTYQKMQLTLALNGKTPELKNIPSRRNHYWGGMYVVYSY